MGNLAIHKIAAMGELLTGKKWLAKENLPSYKMGAMMNLASQNTYLTNALPHQQDALIYLSKSFLVSRNT